MRRFVFFGYLFLMVLPVFSQEMLSVSDTVVLDEIVSYGSLQKFQTGAKIERIGATELSMAAGDNLEQLLSKTLPISFKTDAGGLSTIRIRGTGASHTSVNFGGIDINSLTLGQSNFSTIPAYLFDNLGIQFGSASSVNGSGSIGGAIHLGLQHNWTKGLKTETHLSHGSFGEQMYGAKIFGGNGKWESVTRAFYYFKANNFGFVNPTYRDFENQVFEIDDTQKNAAVEKYGLLQELNYRFGSSEFLTFDIWLERDWRQNQQNMQTNLNNPEYKETYEDRHIRVLAAYKNRTRKFKYEISGGYVFDDAVNNGNSLDTIRTASWLGEAFAEHDLSETTSYKAGAKISRITPTVYAYVNTLNYEDRADIYASFQQRIFRSVTATLNLRQGFVSNYKVPFTPSLGASWLALSKPAWVLNFTANISKSYRVPTFNDRFWVPGGNPDLAPEKGMNYEFGSRWTYGSGSLSGNVRMNVYLMNIDDWILWKNGGSFWYAENVQNVQSTGLEFMTDWKFKLFQIPFATGLNYSLTSTRRVSSLNNSNAINRQLEYVPLHSGNFFLNTNWQQWNFGLDGSYTGRQFTDEDDKNVLNAYFLLNAAASYVMSAGIKNKILLSASFNNLLNAAYQSSWGYAMPGMSYRLSLTYKFN